jgi:plastocyanin
MRLIRALIVAATVALVATAAASPMTHPTLTGSVGPGFTISLKHKVGTSLVLVRTVKAGTYTFVVSDRASIHNFHLKGPGLSRALTAVGFMGTKTVTLVLRKGRYTYVCDVHPTMIGHFTVL